MDLQANSQFRDAPQLFHNESTIKEQYLEDTKNSEQVNRTFENRETQHQNLKEQPIIYRGIRLRSQNSLGESETDTPDTLQSRGNSVLKANLKQSRDIDSITNNTTAQDNNLRHIISNPPNLSNNFDEYNKSPIQSSPTELQLGNISLDPESKSLKQINHQVLPENSFDGNLTLASPRFSNEESEKYPSGKSFKADWSQVSATLQRRIDRYKVSSGNTTPRSPVKSTKTENSLSDTVCRQQVISNQADDKRFSACTGQTFQTYDNICLGPRSFDNPTFKDDNDQLPLKSCTNNKDADVFETFDISSNIHSLTKDNERSAMNSKKKVLHRSCEFLDKYPGSLDKLGNKQPTDNDINQRAPKDTETSLNEGSTVISINIPGDGNIHSFSSDELSQFFRYLRIDENIVQRLYNKRLDGRKFAKLKDKDLEDIGIKNPVICYFRNKSDKKPKIGFML